MLKQNYRLVFFFLFNTCILIKYSFQFSITWASCLFHKIFQTRSWKRLGLQVYYNSKFVYTLLNGKFRRWTHLNQFVSGLFHQKVSKKCRNGYLNKFPLRPQEIFWWNNPLKYNCMLNVLKWFNSRSRAIMYPHQCCVICPSTQSP